MFSRRRSAQMEEVMEAKVEAIMAEGDMGVEAVHEILMNWTPTIVADMMRVSREDRDKSKDTEQDTSEIRVAVTEMYLVLVFITEG